ncbi:ImmA/IrrE family metallo-endopeptidase [Leuconostoc lactis]|uniref:ImmA/IrrE family metallo-endopeptidase n=1 Tax=Leuconostoc lactis TaxID=1246 RepID=UPI0025B1F6F4|nr:ImmA/IrrE family metallo-endopeptidase [Leuconostoc lactis]MDN2649606.1 ImmA/IrrE family metallo-endopeptidase [Leuconostoc lactis]
MNTTNFISEIVEELQRQAKSHNIDILDIFDLSPEAPDFSVVKRQGVFMNINFDTKVSYEFRLAHELSHLLYGNGDIQRIYTFSEFGHRREELLAHRNAIHMLMSIEMPTTVNGFMEYYHVPSWLEHYANETFKSLSVVE